MDVILKKEMVYDRLKRDIVSGRYEYGEKLPPLTGMSKKFDVSMQTMRDAAERLDSDDYIKRVHGRGTFVAWKSAEIARKRYLLLDDRQDPASSNNVIIPLLLQYAAAENFELELCSYEFIARQPIEDSIAYLRKNKIAGVVNTATGYTGNEKILEFFRDCGVPVVLPHGGNADGRLTGGALLHPNEFVAFTDGIRYLAEKGHRRIAVLGNEANGTIRNVSHKAFSELLRELNCEYFSDYFVPADYDCNDIESKAKNLMDSPAPPTAIICYSDFFAMHLYRALKGAGYTIPNDIAVMGYCNSPGGSVFNPSLTSIDIGHEEAAALTLELLKKSEGWFETEDVERPEIFVKHRIVERESTNKRRIESELCVCA
ncbi:MAG: GntR family transcriptional regulator [Victivallales bacterium]|nr:GntR family transcriptional regulator [Victivallales bacterium]